MNKQQGKRNGIDLVEEARQLRLQAEAFEKKVRLARGTHRDVQPPNVVVASSRRSHFVGDEGPTEELLDVVREMLKERPQTFKELLDTTGARDNRIKGVIMRLQREGENVVNLGAENKALWFIADPAVLQRITRARRNAARR